MLSATLIALRRTNRILWVRVALILALSFLAALLTPLFEPLIPEGYKQRFSEEATLPILTILANSMLAVTTFSLSIMVTTHRFTNEQTTPRIHQILLDDTRTQTVLATFVGAFVFALTAIILFRSDYYSDSASVIVFFMTVFVVAVVVVYIVRWIDHLSRLGSMDYALSLAEKAAREALTTLSDYPALGAQTLCSTDDIPSKAKPVIASKSGYLLQIDFEGLAKTAEEYGAEIYIELLPGDHVLASQNVAWVTGHEPVQAFQDCFAISDTRAHEQDARYAIQTLCETACKALSPGINDFGTALQVTSRLERVLWDWLQGRQNDNDGVLYPNLYLRRIRSGTLFDMAFHDIARDGAEFVSVLLRVYEALDNLSKSATPEGRHTLERLKQETLEFAEDGLSTAAENVRFRDGIAVYVSVS